MAENKKKAKNGNDNTAGSGLFYLFIIWLLIFMLFGCLLTGALLAAK